MPSNNEVLKLLVMLTQQQQQTAASQGAYQNQAFQHPPENAQLLSQLRSLQANDNASQAILCTSHSNSNSTLPVNSTDLSQVLHGQPTNATSQQQQLLALLHNTLSSVNAKLATEIAGRAQQQNVLPQSAQNVQLEGLLYQHNKGQIQQQLQTSLQQKTSNSQTQLQLSSQQELNSQAQKMIKQPSKGLSQMPSTVTKHPADSIQGTQEYCSMPSNGSNILKPEPVDIRTLQTYTLEQLEAYVKNLKQRNQPIPNTVKVLLEHEQQIAAKRLSKRISNRKSATVSRNRQRKLIESLLAENKRLRRDALILSHLPDAIVVIGLDGTIKFCNAQMTRITNHSAHELEGRSIKDFLASGSWRPLRHLIHDLEDAERIAASEGWIDNDSADSDGKTSSDGSVSYDNSISISMGKERDNASESTDRTSSKSSNNRENDFGHAALPFKKRKANYDISLNFDMNAGDEMSDSVTSNDADAKLSSLAHHPKSGLSNGHGFKRHKVMLLQDDIKEYCNLDKHMRSRSSYNSNFESSGESTENSSLFMKDSNIIDVDTRNPVAPSCVVQMIRKDLMPILCQVTSSIRTRTVGDVYSNLGITDPANKYSGEPSERELLLCFRPVCMDLKVHRDPHSHYLISGSSIANDEQKESCTENSSFTNEK